MNLDIIKQAAGATWSLDDFKDMKTSATTADSKYSGYERQGFAVPTKDRPLPEKTLTPEQQLNRQIYAAEKEGYEAGKGQYKHTAKQPEWLTEPTSEDPQERLMQEARLRGFSRAQREDIHDIQGFEAAYTHYLPNWVVKYWNTDEGQRLANHIMRGNQHSQYDAVVPESYASAQGKTDIAAEYAGQAKDMIGNPYSEQGQAVLANSTGWVGKTPLLAAQSDAQFYNDVQFANEKEGVPFEYNPSTAANILEGIAGVEDVAGKAVVEDSTINALTFGLGGKLLGSTRIAGVASKPMVAKAVQFLQKAPKLQKALQFTGQSAAMSGPQIFGQAADVATAATGGDETSRLIMGTAPSQLTEEELRATYGNEITNATENAYYQPNIPEGTEIKSPDDMTQYYDHYTKWRQANNIPDEAMNDESNKLAYLNWVVNAGTPATAVFDTSMFQTLEPEHQVEVLENWLPKRVLRQIGATGAVESGWRNFSFSKLFKGENPVDKAAMLNDAILGDTTGVIKDGISRWASNASVPAIMQLIESHAGSGSSGSSSKDALLTTFMSACQEAMKEDNTKIAPMLNGCIKFQAAISNADSKDPKAASKGAEMMRTVFKNVLADPDSFEGMPDKDKLEVIKTLAKVYSSKDGPAMLGQEGDELATKVMSNLQDQALELAKTHPEMWPDLLGAYMMTKGMPDMGEAVSNPWVFWSGAAALLFGGALAIGSVLDDDEDEEEDNAEAEDYDKAIRSAISRVTATV